MTFYIISLIFNPTIGQSIKKRLRHLPEPHKGIVIFILEIEIQSKIATELTCSESSTR